MAEVVEGYDRKLDRRVAVKLLRDDLGDASAKDRFVREARLAAGFSHPNVVTVYDVGEIDGRPYLVMELVEGRTLQELLARRGALPVDHAVRIADALLAALSAAHAHGLVHRDVKPGNMLLGRDGRVKLADFGIAKASRQATLALTATGQMLGTPTYLSPEVVEGHEATPRADLYAVGVVLFEMLTGAPPFVGEHPFAVALAHRDEPVPSLDERRPGLPAGLGAVVTRAMEKDPARRFSSAEEMRHALRELDAPVRAPEGEATLAVGSMTATQSLLGPPSPASAARRRRRRRWPTVLAATLPALLGAAVALVVLSSDGDPGLASKTAGTDAPVATVPSTVPPTTTTTPRSIESLIGLLRASPDAFGEKGEDLLEELLDLQERPSPGRNAKLQRDVRRWLERGELTPTIGAYALEVLEASGDGRSLLGGDGEGGESPGGGFGGD